MGTPHARAARRHAQEAARRIRGGYSRAAMATSAPAPHAIRRAVARGARRVLVGLAGRAVARSVLLAGWALLASLPAAAASTREPPAPRAEAVAPGVYTLRGASGEPDARNLGRVGNAGFVVGEQGVLAVDTGTSARHGRALLAAIRAVTDKPVRLAVVTHARQEFLFGAAAFQREGIPVAMHEKTAGLMKSRCDTCLKRLTTQLGAAAMAGSMVVQPDQVFDAGHVTRLIGRPVELIWFGHSSGPGDTAVLDVQTGTLFAGGLLDVKRVPDVQDADLAGWQRALAALSERPIRRIVPGHGPAGGPEAIAQVAGYLRKLEARMIELASAGAALSEVPDAAAMPEYRSWDQYEVMHRRNASIVFVRVEREQMLKSSQSSSSGDQHVVE